MGGLVQNPYALDRAPAARRPARARRSRPPRGRRGVGTETDGSVTCPSSVNGLVGLKPTVGLVSRTHVVPISHSQDTAGPMGRSVEDAALLLTAMAGSDPADPATRDADAHRADYAAGLPGRAEGQAPRRAGLRHRTFTGVDAAFAQALAVLKARGRRARRAQDYKPPADLGGKELWCWGRS